MIMRFQIFVCSLVLCALVGVTPYASAATDASAVVTRMDSIIKQMEVLKAEFALLASSLGTVPTPTPSVLGASTKSYFTMSLEQGETNDDIKKIQKLLATDKEIYPYGVTSGFFGPNTEIAIKNFQTRFGMNPVGVVGPATKTLLDQFFAAYPNDTYPADVLKKKPAVLGASTSVPPTTTPVTTPTPVVTTPSGSVLQSIVAEYDGEEAEVTIRYTNGTREVKFVEGASKIKVIEALAVLIGQPRASILSTIEFKSSGSNDDDDDNEDDFNVEVEIDGDETIVTFEFDGDDYEVEVDSTDEDDVLEEVADELNEDVDDLDEDLVEAIEDALDEALEDEDDTQGDSEEIESITARIADGEAEIEVEYGDGEEEDFTVDEYLEAKIIEEVADELNMDEDDVEDIIEFKYEDVDEIVVEIKDGKALAFVTFEDGTVKRVRISSDDEQEIIEELADELDEDEDDVEDWTEFDYLD